MKLTTLDRESFLKDPACSIKEEIKGFVRTSPDARLSFMDDYTMWVEPLVRFATGDDPIFDDYKTIIAPTHLTPREALAQAFGKRPDELPGRISVISWILPAVEETRESNRAETSVPSRLWSHTRYYGEQSNGALRKYVVELLTELGHLAVAPFQQTYFKVYTAETGLYSNWSERHVAFAAGQGTFSLSDGLITEAGIAHRCGSVVTDLVLPPSPRTAEGPYSNCLFYAGVNCRACMKRCPADAITEQGHDKNLCKQYLNGIGYSSEALKSGYDNETSVAGCGLCQTKVPCEHQNPVRKMTRSFTKR
jgi:epoxyqueuosine reductase QueG